MRLARSTSFIVIATLLAMTPGAAAQSPGLNDVLARASAYIQTFVSKFSNVVAEERYVQERNSSRRLKRELHSDYFLINLPGSSDWLEFRDVYEVDGKPVGDRENRLLKLVQSGTGTSADWVARARAVSRESTRFNVEDIGTLNRPLVVLSLLQSQYQPRFEFKLGALDKKLGPDARLIQFRESSPIVMFRTGPVRGRAWVDEKTGAILKTELEFGSTRFPNTITTTFAPDPDLKVSVPVEMKEWYGFGVSGAPMTDLSFQAGSGQAGTMVVGTPQALSSNAFDVTGHATYGRFRKFGVSSVEEFVN